VNVEPSVTRYCIVSTLVVSIVGAYTSDSTPPATVYQIFDVVLRAVPRQSLRARSKWLSAPGPVGVSAAAGRTAARNPATVRAMINDTRTRMGPAPSARVVRIEPLRARDGQGARRRVQP